MKKKDRLGIGFVGGGFITRFHIRSWVGVRDADVLGIVDPDEKRAREAAALAKSLRVGEPRVFKSLAAMASDPRIDAIWIGSPNYTRLEVMDEIAQAMLKGKAGLIGVACEKPLGRNVGEAKAMLTLARKAGVLDGYLENQVISPAVVRGKEIVWARGASLCGPPFWPARPRSTAGPTCPGFGRERSRAGASSTT